MKVALVHPDIPKNAPFYRTGILDVGCGIHPLPQATVCGDLYLGETEHRISEGTKTIRDLLKSKEFEGKMFIQLDCYHLPFPANSFAIVYCKHLLEHLEYPTKALREFERVAKKKVIVRVPDFRGYGLEDPDTERHYNTWSMNSFRNILGLVYDKVIVKEICVPLSWDRKGIFPKIFNFVMKRALWRFFVFSAPEIVGICYLNEAEKR